MSVPNLELEHISTENTKIIGPVMSQLYVYYNNNTTLYSPEDLHKLHSIYEAKLNLCTRKDITYYINADDLLKIQSLSNDKNPLNLQIIVPTDNFEGKKRKSSPKESSPKGGSPKLKDSTPKLKDRTKSESPRRKSVSRTTSSDDNSKKIAAKNAVELYGKSYNSMCNKSSPTLSFLSTPEISTVTFNGIVINNQIYDITFINDKDNELFSIFVIEPLGSPNKLLCKGLLDSQVNVELVSKCASLDYTFEPSPNKESSLEVKPFKFTVYSQTFDNFVVPLYIVIMTDKAECNTKQFVNILEQLFKLVKFEK